MIEWPAVLSITHLIGLALAVGSATVKLVLLLRCRAHPPFAATFLEVSGPVTRLIILGMILLSISGIGWLFLGYGLTARLAVKLALFASIWVLGPVIDKRIEPRLRNLAPRPGDAATPAYAGALRGYLVWETVATALFYVIVLIWMIPF